MVFNVTKDDIRVRMSVIDEEVWPSPAQKKKKNAPDTSKLIPFSDFTKSGALPLPEVVGPIFDEINETACAPASRCRTRSPTHRPWSLPG